MIRGNNGLAVATIDASGSASFAGDVIASGSGTFNKLFIASPASGSGLMETQGQTPSANATIGKATLPAGTTQIEVSTTKVTENSYIYITPISSTNNNVLYIKQKTICYLLSAICHPGFTVSIDQSLPQDVQFNWWVIN